MIMGPINNVNKIREMLGYAKKGQPQMIFHKPCSGLVKTIKETILLSDDVVEMVKDYETTEEDIACAAAAAKGKFLLIDEELDGCNKAIIIWVD